MSLPIFDLQQAFTTASAAAAVITIVAGLFAALRAGTVSRVRVGSFTIEGGLKPEDIAEFKRSTADNTAEDKPFEVIALSNYYNHALSRANVSFWFSIIFGAIGFGVIIFAFATHDKADLWGTVVKAGSGTIIDAVSSLFFVQSTNAQKSMAEFFEKLRLDRLNSEARSLILEIENGERRDQLRAQLVLKYAGIDKLLEGK
jgi:hypothetical protein